MQWNITQKKKIKTTICYYINELQKTLYTKAQKPGAEGHT